MLYAGEALSSMERNLEPKTYNLEHRTVREPRPTKIPFRPLTALAAFHTVPRDCDLSLLS
jgi:hypothetical protein